MNAVSGIVIETSIYTRLKMELSSIDSLRCSKVTCKYEEVRFSVLLIAFEHCGMNLISLALILYTVHTTSNSTLSTEWVEKIEKLFLRESTNQKLEIVERERKLTS